LDAPPVQLHDTGSYKRTSGASGYATGHPTHCKGSRKGAHGCVRLYPCLQKEAFQIKHRWTAL